MIAIFSKQKQTYSRESGRECEERERERRQ